MVGAIKVQGLRELHAALKQVDAGLPKLIRTELKDVSEPARALAEELAVGNISHIGGAWSRMRLGVTSRYVYLAPAKKRSGGSPRPNLGRLLLGVALIPAAEEKRPEIMSGLETKLDALERRAGL